MLTELAPDLWVTQRPLRFLGIEMGSRMTVVRLRSGELFLHSPVRLDAELRKELDALGRVAFAVAPNRYHHLYVGDVATHYPGAELHAAPGLPERRRDVGFHAVLGDEAPPGWEGEIQQLVFRAIPMLKEVVFLHRASRTLLLCDLSCHFRGPVPLGTRLFLAVVGGYGRFGPTRLERWLMRDRRAGREALERILAWDFDRIVVSHGEVLESGGKDALARGYRWLLAG